VFTIYTTPETEDGGGGIWGIKSRGEGEGNMLGIPQQASCLLAAIPGLLVIPDSYMYVSLTLGEHSIFPTST
jgi:hypothetical protein